MKYIFALFMILAAGFTPSLVADNEVPVGETLRNLPMKGLTSNSKFISDYRGKPLIINVWASYCSPCLAEMGSLERLWQRNSDHFNVIGISIDDYRDRADKFLAKADTTFPHYIDNQLQLEKMLGSRTIPLTLLIDAQSRVLQKVNGAQEWDSAVTIEMIGQIFEIDLQP
jgi:thiol-disulfide isomerase/thioredoxin